MSSRENPVVAVLDVPDGGLARPDQSPPGRPNPNDPVALLHLLVNLQNQTLETPEARCWRPAAAARTGPRGRPGRPRAAGPADRRARALAGGATDRSSTSCRESLGKLEQVHAALMGELADYVEENHENLVEGDFALTDFVDRFGPRLAHLNTMLAVLRPLAAAVRKPEG